MTILFPGLKTFCLVYHYEHGFYEEIVRVQFFRSFLTFAIGNPAFARERINSNFLDSYIMHDLSTDRN